MNIQLRYNGCLRGNSWDTLTPFMFEDCSCKMRPPNNVNKGLKKTINLKGR